MSWSHQYDVMPTNPLFENLELTTVLAIILAFLIRENSGHVVSCWWAILPPSDLLNFTDFLFCLSEIYFSKIE